MYKNQKMGKATRSSCYGWPSAQYPHILFPARPRTGRRIIMYSNNTIDALFTRSVAGPASPPVAWQMKLAPRNPCKERRAVMHTGRAVFEVVHTTQAAPAEPISYTTQTIQSAILAQAAPTVQTAEAVQTASSHQAAQDVLSQATQAAQKLQAAIPSDKVRAAVQAELSQVAQVIQQTQSANAAPAVPTATEAVAPHAAPVGHAQSVQTVPTVKAAVQAKLAQVMQAVQQSPWVKTTPAVQAAVQAELVQVIQAAQQTEPGKTTPAVQAAAQVKAPLAIRGIKQARPVMASQAVPGSRGVQRVTAAPASPALRALPDAQSPMLAANPSDAAVACHFCTVAGSSYLFKVVTLYRSLEAVSSDFQLYVCCIDDNVLSTLSKLRLSRCIPVSVNALNDSELSRIRSQRSASEFCWTLKSHFLLYLLTEKNLPQAVYLDSDVAFFSDPRRLYDDWGNASVYLCRQRDLGWVEQKYGRYQAGVIGFRNDTQGLSALRWWRDKCRAWCYATPDTGLYGDQKYLDEIPGLFSSVKISTHRGIDAAPWNTVYNNNYPITISGSDIIIDGDPLVAYHFACLDVIDEQHFDLWNLSGISIGQTISNAIYVPYLAKLRNSMAEIKLKSGGVTQFYSRKPFGDAKTPYIFSERNLSLKEWDGINGFCTIASKQYAARTLALYESLQKHAGNFHIWICCMDDMANAIFSGFRLANATLIKLSEIETAAVRQTRGSKKLYEYCWTLKPLLCQFVFEHYNISRLLYCDSDMYFFSSPQVIHDEWRRYETFLNLQRGTKGLEAQHGMYQAGLVGFTKASESLKILNWWAQKCTSWCYDDHSDPDRWGDQKYLTQIPDLFSSIKVNNKYGILAAPWNLVMNNIRNLPVHTDDNGVIWLEDEALTCYHFGSINVLGKSQFDLWKHEPLQFDPAIIESIYKPYLAHLRDIYGAIKAKGFDISGLFEKSTVVQNPFSV